MSTTARQRQKVVKSLEKTSLKLGNSLKSSIIKEQKLFSEHPGLLQSLIESINPEEKPLYLSRRLKEEDIEVLYAQAYRLYEASQLEEALLLFWMMALYNYQDKRAWLGIGASSQQLKQYTVALKGYAALSQLDEKDPYPYFHSSECYLELQQLPEALHQLEQALHHSENMDHYTALHEKAKKTHKTLLAQKKQPRKNQ